MSRSQRAPRQPYSSLELILIATLVTIAAIDAYFFLVLPQDWTLRDDYGFALVWGAPGADVWHLGREYLKGIMATGRFQPVDVLWRIVHYGYLPVTPRAFRLSFFALAAFALSVFARLLRLQGASRAAVWLALVLVAGNLAMKEWLTTLTVSESWATTFLLIALALYSSSRTTHRWLAPMAFLLSVFSKESFFVFCGLFPLLDLAGRRRDRAPGFVIVGLALAFALFIRSLPHVYTSGLSFAKLLDVPNVLKSLVLPPLKSFAPAFLLLALGLQRGQLRSPLALAGLYIVVVFSLFINAWGPFDSWFYLHTVIPFGWAMLFAALWRPGKNQEAVALLLLAALTMSAANGGRNYTLYFSDAKVAAELACRDAARAPGLRVFSNCNEGSSQLASYLRLSGRCATPPVIRYLNGAPALTPAQAAAPYELLLSDKCDPFEAPKEARPLRLHSWSVVSGG